MSEDSHAPEEGRIGLLMAACLFIVAAFVLTSALVTAVAVEDRRLLACADRVAAATAGIVDAEAYYGGGALLLVSSDSSARVAEDALESLRASTCDVGAGAKVVEVSRQGAQVRVAVSARANLPFIPGFLQGAAAPILTRSSTARVSLVP